ncbi:Osmotin-like protein TPM-1 [Hibiscus syriacus]|uniref:Osmotin-like protein TPM-1 n=1 Tax=Hibiscus syriacus TaxID=106335 RepID=A0A6A2YXW6_HIBSY|nr:Osmotin-like protein TPM-1 [Hibiscus syriacus]
MEAELIGMPLCDKKFSWYGPGMREAVACFLFVQQPLFEIRHECSYTVWAAASPGGGRRLDPFQSWTINVPAGTAMARIWGRTNCNFDSSGRGRCQTGDCGGLLQCRGWGAPPNTLAEYELNQFQNLDFYDISLVDGFNIPMVFGPTSWGCHNIRCTADINGQCPSPGSCNATDFSRFFKMRCPDSYSYPQDDPTSTFNYPGGANYRVVFALEARLIWRWLEARAVKSKGIVFGL